MPKPASLLIDADCRDLLGFVQASRETQRGAVARVLHDDIGAVLIAALMDTDSASRALRTGKDAPAALKHLSRAETNLRLAIMANRDIQEKLRPSILDEFGLFAACRWLARKMCRQAGLSCQDNFPSTELKLSSATAITLYRAVEGLIHTTLKEDELANLTVSAWFDPQHLEMSVAHTHRTVERDDLGQSCLPEISETVERVNGLGGTCAIVRDIAGSSAVLTIPTTKVLPLSSLGA